MKTFYIDEKECYIKDENYDMTVLAEEVLLKINYVGLCGSDLNTYRKLSPMVKYPVVPGHEISAEIIEKGSSVPDTWQISDNVCVIPYSNCGKCAACKIGRFNCCQNNQTLGVQRNGSLQEYLKIHHSKLLKFDGISKKDLAFVEPLSVGYHATQRGRAQKDEFVVVIGCGVIGIGAILAAVLKGAKVIAIDIDDRKLELLKQYGVYRTINSMKEDVKAVIAEITDGCNASLVIEAVGNPITYTMAIDIVSFAGRVVYIGYAKQPVSYESKYFVMKELDIMGSRNAEVEDFKAVGKYLSEKRFDVTPLLSKEFSLEKSEDALKFWSENTNDVFKILIAIGEDQ